MRKFTPESAVSAIELQQLKADWCNELDKNNCRDVAHYFTEDCFVDMGAVSHTGHDAMNKFYAARKRTRSHPTEGRHPDPASRDYPSAH